MRAMLLDAPHEPLRLTEAARAPRPGAGEVLIRVKACGVCRTDLHLVDGELANPRLPLVPGHEIIGTVVETGIGVERIREGDRIGVPWLGWTCGTCRYCSSGRENLCERARFTGYQIDGGYAEYTIANERYCFTIPPCSTISRRRRSSAPGSSAFVRCALPEMRNASVFMVSARRLISPCKSRVIVGSRSLHLPSPVIAQARNSRVASAQSGRAARMSRRQRL